MESASPGRVTAPAGWLLPGLQGEPVSLPFQHPAVLGGGSFPDLQSTRPQSLLLPSRLLLARTPVASQGLPGELRFLSPSQDPECHRVCKAPSATRGDTRRSPRPGCGCIGGPSFSRSCRRQLNAKQAEESPRRNGRDREGRSGTAQGPQGGLRLESSPPAPSPPRPPASAGRGTYPDSVCRQRI